MSNRRISAKWDNGFKDQLDFKNIRNSEGIKETSVTIEDKTLNLVIANGLNNAKKILDRVKKGDHNWHLIEIMACPGGCIAGGGQPMMDVDGEVYPLDKRIIKKRTEALYNIDKDMPIRK